jgi:hypothetical protein
MIYTGADTQKCKRRRSCKDGKKPKAGSFQQYLHDIFFKWKYRRYALTVRVQNYTNTLQLLSANNISLHDSWYKSDEELCRILNVDAVIRMKIQKKRYMSGCGIHGY